MLARDRLGRRGDTRPVSPQVTILRSGVAFGTLLEVRVGHRLHAIGIGFTLPEQ